MLTSQTADLLGRRLIAYMLGIGEIDLDAVLANADDERVNVLVLVEQVGKQLAARSEGIPGEGDVLALTALVSLIRGVPVANTIRALVTETPPIELSDRPLALLQAIAFDALPAWIAEDTHRNPTEPWRSVGFSFSTINNHPAASLFVEAVLRDADLSRLFPARDANGEAVGVHLYASGTGGDEQLVMLASSLLKVAWEQSPEDTPEAVFAALRSVVESARVLGRTSVIDSTVRIGFRGLELPVGSHVALPWGTLRPPEPTDFQIRFGVERFDPGIDAVLETTRPVKVLIRESAEPTDDAWTSAIRDWHSESELVKRKTALTMLLALERDPPIGMAPVAEHVVKPISSGDGVSWQQRQLLRGPTGLEVGDECRIEAIGHLVEHWYSPSIEIAITRTLRSLAERADPVDGLIDSVIALESLFSAGSGELRFRISASIAWLLEPDVVDRRKALYLEVKKLYDARSEVLHGRAITAEAATRTHLRAAMIAVHVLRTLFERRPELIADRNRGETLLVIENRRDDPHEAGADDQIK